MIKKIVAFSIGTIMLAGGCASESAEVINTEDQSKDSLESIEVKDSNGLAVDVPVNPEKVVIFDMGLLDTFEVLDSKDKVVGTVTQSLPDYLSSFGDSDFVSVGSLKEPDLEAVYELDPDLILISGRQLDFLDELDKIAPTLYLSVDLENYWDSFAENMQTIGQILLMEEQVEAELDSIQKEMGVLQEAAQDSGKSTLVTILNEGSLSAFGEYSRYGMLYEEFGFIPVDNSIESSIHGQSISYEYILQENPDLLFVVDRSQAIGGDTSISDLSLNPVIQETRAYQQDAIIYLDADLWYLSGGGLQSIQLMIQEVQNQVEF